MNLFRNRTRPRFGLLGAASLVALVLVVMPMSALALGSGSGSISLTGIGTTYGPQDFDALSNLGTTNSLTINGWFMDESGTSAVNNGQYAAGTGSSATGDTYSFGGAGLTERALGGLRSGTLVPTFGAQFTNNTGSAVSALDISYTGEMWRAGVTNRNAADRLDFELSTNATGVADTAATWVAYNALDYDSTTINTGVGALNGNTNSTAKSATITGFTIANGASFWVRWTDFDISSSDDGLAVDTFSLTPRLASNPTGTGAASPSTVPYNGTTLLTVAVTGGSSPPSTGLGVTCDLTSIGGSATQQLFDDGSNGDVSSGNLTFSYTTGALTATGPKTLPCTITDAQARSGSASISLVVEGPLVPIHTIQGATHISPLTGNVQATTGIVTTTTANGFWIEDPTPDADVATSEGIFVFTTSVPTVNVGDQVRVSGLVQEFRPGGAGSANLTTTEIVRQAVTVLSSGNPLPAATIAGVGGRVPPDTVIEDDAAGDVETSGVFDPSTDGIDFWESLEGMRVTLTAPVAVGPTNSFGETVVLGDNGALSTLRTARGGVVVRPTDFNGERIVLDGFSGVTMPVMNAGDHYVGSVTGVLDYNFGAFFLMLGAAPAVIHDGVTPEATVAPGPHELAVATFNVENLAPGDSPAKYSRLANLIVNNLQAPDLISVEEVQDNSGATDNGVVAANTTMATLITAIQTAGGPTYDWRGIDPVNNADGGQPGGNIRQVFLFRTDRGLAFIDRPGGTSTGATTVTGSGAGTQLTFSPGRIDPANTAWNTSRKPLAGEFTYHGRHLFVIVNHFNSKGGDQPLLGHFQPPVRSSEIQRHAQAQVVHDFVADILAADPNANIVVDGDLNDFEFSQTVSILKGTELQDLIDTLPPNERYSYVFEGNSQTLDHILLSNPLFANPFVFDVVHVNAEFADQASDHDPSVVRLSLPVLATHDITFTKTCSTPTAIGDQYTCRYAMENDVDAAHDTLTVTALNDTVHAASSDQNSGPVLNSLQLVATAGSPSCTGGSGSGTVGSPWVGVSSCTLPFGARIESNNFSFYAVQPADYGLPGHELEDEASLTWHDLCNDPAGTGNGNCVADPAAATAESQTTVVQLAASTATQIHSAADAVVTTVEAGSNVHDFVTVTGQSGKPTPTGNVTIDWFLNGDCSGAPAQTGGPFALNAAGQVDATGFSFTAGNGLRAFKAHYASDGTYAGSDGPCEQLTVVDANIQLSPLTATNEINTTHTLTAHVNAINGTSSSNAPDGTQIGFGIISGPGSFTSANPCTTTGGTGSCQITLSSAVTGTTIVQATVTLSVGGVTVIRTTGDGKPGDSANATEDWVDSSPPVTTLVLDPANPDVNGWYVFAVKPTVSATDSGGVAETRCVLDPAVVPAAFDDLPSAPCPYLAPSQYVTSEGIHTLYAASKDTAGNKETPVKSIQFKIDKTPPVASVGALSMFQGAATFPVSWSGTDNLSGVKDYDVRYRQAASNGSFGGYTTWLFHTTSTSASFTAPAGSTTCFSVKARDNAGWSPFAWSAEQCTTVPLDDPALSRIGFWATVTGSGYYGPGVSRSTSTGNRLSASMRGQTIGVLVTRQPGGATIELRWNGSTRLSTSLSAGSVQKQQLLTFNLGSVQTGTLEIVQAGFGTADIDGAGANKTS